ncbi:MAG: hypothetical protein QNJ72_26230 [Pleurocapsa sp. MO_226.B13]|nr:hypothetical protein [Pleurocapsa sp. MO_226.B13]
MSACQDLIFFDNSEDWELIVNETRDAVQVGENSYIPIGSFDLGVSIENKYVAVVASTTSGRPTWVFAGDITQVYDFAPGGSNPILGKVRPQPFKLFINRMQVIPTGRISPAPFRLQYTPPAWFKDVAIRVYAYTGDKLNFVEDALFDLGNALGIDPNNPDGLVSLAFASLRDLIEQKFQEVCDKIDNLGGGSGGSGGTTNFGFTGGGGFEPNNPQDNIGFGFYQGLL